MANSTRLISYVMTAVSKGKHSSPKNNMVLGQTPELLSLVLCKSHYKGNYQTDARSIFMTKTKFSMNLLNYEYYYLPTTKKKEKKKALLDKRVVLNSLLLLQ